MTHDTNLRALALALATGVLLVGAGTARADVRVDDPGAPEPGLAIRLSPAGPWSLVGPFDETVLNPAGDAYGDGLPADAAQGEHMLAGWVRPSDGRVHLSRWALGSWAPLPAFEAQDSVGTPRVDPLGTGWAVTWQQDALDPVIRAAGVGADGTHFDSQPILGGWLVDETWIENVQLVLHWDADRERLLLTGVLWSVPGVPSPVDILFQNELSELEPEGQDGVPSPMISRAPHPGGGDADRLRRGAWAHRAVVSWWDADGVMHQSIIDKDGDSRELNKPKFDTGIAMTPPDGAP